MNKKLTRILVGTTVAAVVLGAGAAIAKESAEQITAVYRNIKLVVDGVMVEPKDANGNVVEPFIYNGTTYLPVRAVGEAFDKQVEWDGEKNMVYLGGVVDKPAKELELWNRSYIECNNTSQIRGYQDNGMGYISCVLPRLGEKMSDGRWFRSYDVTYPVNALAKSFKGTYYITGGNTCEGVLKVFNSNGKELYESPILRNTTTPVNFEVNIENEIAIKIVFEQKVSNDADSESSIAYIKDPIIVSSDY